MPLTLLRHTTPNHHQGLCYGRLDLDLADSFVVEARRALAALGKVTAIYSSPLSRCMRLAEFIAERHDILRKALVIPPETDFEPPEDFVLIETDEDQTTVCAGDDFPDDDMLDALEDHMEEYGRLTSFR